MRIELIKYVVIDGCTIKMFDSTAVQISKVSGPREDVLGGLTHPLIGRAVYIQNLAEHRAKCASTRNLS